MKTPVLVILLFGCSLTGIAQSKYAVEIVGGMKFYGQGFATPDGGLQGITGGLGVNMSLSNSIELTGTTLFTYFSPTKEIVHGSPVGPFNGSSTTMPDNGQYSSEILAGLRFHGRGSGFIHPYLIIQGGMMLLRSQIYQGPWAMPALSAQQLLNIQGTEDIQMLGSFNLGGGVQLRMAESILLNLEAKYQILMGNNSPVDLFIPVVISVQLPA